MRNWTPTDGKDRQKDYTRTNARAKRLRRSPTIAEAQLWRVLRALNKNGAHFRRQIALGGFVFDFGDYSRRLLVEVDGGVHRLPEVVLRDNAKAEWAASQGFMLMRFENREVLGGPDGVLHKVRVAYEAAPHP